MVLHLIHFLVGGSVSSPAMLPSQATVWDLLCLPLVAPLVPPRYTFPDSSFDSCLAWTSNVVHASLAVLPLKNLHLRHSQMAAARSRVGPNHGSLIRHTAWGSRTFLSCVNLSSVVIFRGDIALDSGNALGCLSESSVWQLLSTPCQRSRGRISWPVMTCWPQMMTCECAPPKGDRSTSQSFPRPLSFIPSWAAV